MDIKILDSWLRDHIKTDAKAEKIAECLSLCGPSFERLHDVDGDIQYDVEITTNRVDTASHFGIAREAGAILPRFTIEAKLLPLKTNSKQKLVKKVDWLDVKVDHKLCPRFTTILIKDVVIKPSPTIVQDRLKAVGLRPINNVVDISNYLMLDLGQPVHTFDYDKIAKTKMNLRASQEGEEIITLDGKTHKLPGGDIVIEDGEGRLIDLCGIMGGELSAIDENTKNVLLFVQTYDPVAIRKTSMSLAHRTDAAQLFEKGLDPEQVEITIRRGIDMFEQLCEGTPENEILDLYPAPYTEKSLSTTLSFINKRLGVELSEKEVTDSLEPLGFTVKWNKETLTVKVPSWRSRDVDIQEDILEEVARIYGYHNLPSILMPGLIPDPLENPPFAFEQKIRTILKGWGGVEVYTLSLVAKDKVSLTGEDQALKLRNPLGSDSEYLRMSLAPSLSDAASQTQEKNPFHLFEIANVYIPIANDLPQENMTLAGVLKGYSWELAKGIVEGLLQQLGVTYSLEQEDAQGFERNQRLVAKSNKEIIGQLGILEDKDLFYYEFSTQALQKIAHPLESFKPIPKYPSQIEDISVVWPHETQVGPVMEMMQSTDAQITSVELVDTYENSKTFRITYQNLEKTLTNEDVQGIREKIIDSLHERGIDLKQS